jgi:hypothetical protein
LRRAHDHIDNLVQLSDDETAIAVLEADFQNLRDSIREFAWNHFGIKGLGRLWR